MASPAAASLLQDSPVPADVTAFLTDVGGQFKGTTTKVVTENTPPGTAIRALMEEQFVPVTGINVEWEVVPLDQVLAKVSLDAAQQLGQHDVYYVDQAWVGRFVNDTLDPRELLQAKPDLAFPNYDIVRHRRLPATARRPHRLVRRQDARLPVRRADLPLHVPHRHLPGARARTGGDAGRVPRQRQGDQRGEARPRRLRHGRPDEERALRA
jgi:hypothetical protein